MEKRIKNYLKTIFQIVFAFILSFVIIPQYFVRFVVVNGQSMNYCLENNEILLVNVWSGKFGHISRGDVVDARGKETQDLWIKRVIGLPGETLSIHNDTIYINGKALEESYLDEAYVQSQKEQYGSFMDDMQEITLGEDEYFLLGDNRRHSLDSRKVGVFHRKDIVGIAQYIVYPFDQIGSLY